MSYITVEREFKNKVRTKRGYILLLDDKPIGLLRYNLFWTIRHFVQCFSLIGNIKEEVMENNL